MLLDPLLVVDFETEDAGTTSADQRCVSPPCQHLTKLRRRQEIHLDGPFEFDLAFGSGKEALPTRHSGCHLRHGRSEPPQTPGAADEEPFPGPLGRRLNSLSELLQLSHSFQVETLRLIRITAASASPRMNSVANHEPELRRQLN